MSKLQKNCKTLTGWPKKESSFGSVHSPSNQLFSPAIFILLLVLVLVLTITVLFIYIYIYIYISGM